MKKLLSLLLSVLMCAALLPIVSLQAAQADERYLEINETNFPDDNFRQWVIDNLPHEGDAASGYYMTKEQVESVTEINCPGRQMNSLVGIEHFTELTYLDCYSNYLDELDVSNNTALTYLNCYSNQLTTLDLSNNTALKYLKCVLNQLTTLDVSNNTALESLSCSYNWLTALDVNNNTALESLSCSYNYLISLDVSNNAALRSLTCNKNELTALDVSNNTALTYLHCDENQLSVLNIGHLVHLVDLSRLDVSPQTIPDQVGGYSDGQYYYDLSSIVPNEMLQNVTIENAAYYLNTATGIVTFPQMVNSFKYYYDTGYVAYNGQHTRMAVTVCLTFAGQNPDRYLEINETNFPDDNFRQWVIDNLPHEGVADSGYYMTKAQVDSVTEINYNAYYGRDKLQSLVGIEHFTALTYLSCCGWNQLTSLDVSNNTALTYLNCYNNQLTTLDVSNNTALIHLDCKNNQLTTLDVSKCIALEWLDCENNQLTTLDVSNTTLTELDCSYNQLTTLDVSNNTALTKLNCYANELTVLDVCNDTALTDLNCYNNQLTTLDVSNNTALTYLKCYRNQLTTLDVSNNTALTKLDCSWSQLTVLDVSNNTALTSLGCSGNRLTTLDVSNNTALKSLYCSYNQLTTLDVSNTTLIELDCSWSQLTVLDVSNTILTVLDCSYNQLTTLDVSNTTLIELDCSFNQLTTLDVSNNTALTKLICYANELTVLDVCNDTALTDLNCSNNQLTTLDVSNNTALTSLGCSDNQLTSLDVSNNTALTSLSCGWNQLTSLDVSNNTALTSLGCSGNRLTTLDLSNNTSLRYLDCSNNHLSILNLSILNAGQLISLYDLDVYEQTIPDQVGGYSDGQYYYDLSSIVPKEMLENVTIKNATYHLNTTTGIVTFPSRVDSFTYNYDTGYVYYGRHVRMDVTVYLTFEDQPSERYLEINETNFPDDNFRQWVIDNLPHEGNAASGYYMTKAQVDNVTEIVLTEDEDGPFYEIESVSGIEFFPALTHLDCSENFLTSLDVSRNTALTSLGCSDNQLTSLDVSSNTALKQLLCGNNRLTALDVSSNPALEWLDCGGNDDITELDVTKNPALQVLECYGCKVKTLDLSKNTALLELVSSYTELTTLDLSNNTNLQTFIHYGGELTALDLSSNPALVMVWCPENHISYLNAGHLESLDDLDASAQTIPDQVGGYSDGQYYYDLSSIVPKEMLENVTIENATYHLNTTTGTVTFPSRVDSFTYDYDTGYVYYDDEPALMDVTVSLTYDGLPGFDGTIEWYRGDVLYNGKTPYVIANGKAQTPRFTVKAEDGSVIEPSHYTYEYLENVNAGTAYVMITFTDTYSGTAQGWFKIYLPATDYTKVENRDGGIYMEWHAVEGAAGYVIYRRAWNLQSAGWTDFVRWNNTTELHWTDKTVYAGTRYQYGVKAYFERRVDPVSGATIGGNVGDNYNLGQVGPLKTTVRITTRKLNSVTPGKKQLTIKWAGSSLFTGYEVQIATDAAFTKNVKTVKITNPKTYQTTIKSLKAKTTYYVRVRSYHVFEGMTYFGGWSNVLNAKTK